MFEEMEFTHAFQPIVSIEKGEIISYEVLLRGINNEPPFSVFNKVKKKDLINFDQYNREKALTFAARLGLNCSINLNFTPGSVLFDGGSNVLKTIFKAKELGFSSKQLVIEITENEFITSLDVLSDVLNKIRKEKVVIAIDDFGAGYAGLNMLADIQPDIIKIDMSLLRNINENGPRQSIVRALDNVCLDLGIDILAEGVETEAEFNWLKNIGIDIYQGYYFAKPAFECLLTKDELIFKPALMV
uniref:EAL domain-containing protein n=1 Tax=Marinobacterium profundum TaxID=1714300 RepID=UPI00082CE7CC|nr:EAL domain-containing protein [Marinobacterium profundum]